MHSPHVLRDSLQAESREYPEVSWVRYTALCRVQ